MHGLISLSDATSYDKSIFDEETIIQHVQFAMLPVFDFFYLVKSDTSPAEVPKPKVPVWIYHSDGNMYAVLLDFAVPISVTKTYFSRQLSV